MSTTTQVPGAATKLATGADIKTAKPGAKLRFGGGLYLLISPAGAKSWQVHYHVVGRHQATIVGRWPDLGVTEARAKRDEIKRTVREGGDPAIVRAERRTARQEGEKATVRTIGAAWFATAKEARHWSDGYARHVKLRLDNHVYPAIGDRPIGRVRLEEIEALIGGMVTAGVRAQAIHVRQCLQLLFDYAARRKLVTENPVRVIADDLPRRIRGPASGEVCRAHVSTITDARLVLRAVETSTATPFAKLAHRLIALTAVRKMEAVEARWSELGENGMTWTIPAERMKGRRGAKRPHVAPLSPQAADVFRAARAWAEATGIRSDMVFPGKGVATINRSGLNEALDRALPTVGLAGRHTVHGWRATFSTICNEADPVAYRVIDVMLAHKAFGEVEARYNKAVFLEERRRLACVWADQLLDGAPSAFAVAGLEAPRSNVVPLREAA